MQTAQNTYRRGGVINNQVRQLRWLEHNTLFVMKKTLWIRHPSWLLIFEDNKQKNSIWDGTVVSHMLLKYCYEMAVLRNVKETEALKRCFRPHLNQSFCGNCLVFFVCFLKKKISFKGCISCLRVTLLCTLDDIDIWMCSCLKQHMNVPILFLPHSYLVLKMTLIKYRSKKKFCPREHFWIHDWPSLLL